MLTATYHPYVLFLSGEHLGAERVTVPGGAIAVWCRRPEEIVDRAERLRPRCIFLDRNAVTDPSGLARAIRRAACAETIVAVVGRNERGAAPADCDVAV